MHLSKVVILCCYLNSSLAYVHLVTRGFRANSHPAGNRKFTARKSKSLEVKLENLVSFYQIELGLGTPSQKTVYTIDTGSSDLWIMSNENPKCGTGNAKDASLINCTGEYAFDYQRSTTFSRNKTQIADRSKAHDDYNFQIAYGDTTMARGFWGTDVVQIGDATLNNCSLAVATLSNATTSVMGIGLLGTETTRHNSHTGTDYVYRNIPYLLKDQGVTKSVAYSIWLNSFDSKEGNVLFGAIDHGKYKGPLGLIPMVKLNPSEIGLSPEDPVRTAVMLHGVGVENDKGEKSELLKCSIPVLLDSGSTANYLPMDIVKTLGNAIGGKYISELGAYIYNCDAPGGIILNFSGLKITVPLSYLGLAITDTDDMPVEDEQGNKVCALGVLPNSSQFILGDAALRAMYAVYDLEHYEIALASSNIDSKTSNITEISDCIPGAVKAPGYSSTVPSYNIWGTASPTFTMGTPNSRNLAKASSVGH